MNGFRTDGNAIAVRASAPTVLRPRITGFGKNKGGTPSKDESACIEPSSISEKIANGDNSDYRHT
jgi:hypothetical protein